MKSLVYCPELNSWTGSVNASLLFMQLEYWFKTTTGKPFYKFLEPCESPRYKAGDSWTEELGLSKREFRSAFCAIGKVYKSKSAYVESKDKFEGKYYLSYYDRLQKCTFYIRNDQAAGELLRNTKSALGYSKDYALQFSQSSYPNHSTDLDTPLSEETVLNLFERHCPSLGKLAHFTATAKKRLQALLPLLQAKGLALYQTLEQVFSQVEASDYLCGRTVGSKWRALLSWILRPDKFFEILKGKYAPYTQISLQSVPVSSLSVPSSSRVAHSSSSAPAFSSSATHSSSSVPTSSPSTPASSSSVAHSSTGVSAASSVSISSPSPTRTKWIPTFNRMELHNFDLKALEAKEKAFQEACYLARQS